jgi:hypothetical protein
MSARRLARIIGAAIFILIVNVSLSVAYMVFYSYLINPGRDERFYQEHIKTAAPYCSIFFGIPLFYFVCRWIGGKWEKEFALKASIFVWIVYLLIDAAVLVAAGLTLKIAVLAAISLATKFVSAYFGGISAGRKNHGSI